MKACILAMLRVIAAYLLWSACATSTAAGDMSCFGYTSKTNHFYCTAVGNCTWWAAAKRHDLAAAIDASNVGGWNGGEWYDKLKTMGFPVGKEPRSGAIVEFSSPGHVAYIEKLNADGSFDVTEMDSTGSLGNGGLYIATYYPNGDGTYSRNHGSTRWVLKGFIYAKGAATASDTNCDPTKRKCDIRVKGDVGWYPPVNICQNATQWYRLVRDTTGKVSRVESTTQDVCPLACFAN